MKPYKSILNSAILLPTLIVITAIAAGCRDHKGERLLGQVPAGADVSVINVDMLLKNAGCKIDNGIVTLTPDLELLKAKLPQKTADLMSYMTLAAPAIDLNEVISFKSGTSAVLLFRIKAPEILGQIVKVGSDNENETDGVTYYNLDDAVIGIDGNTGWISNEASSIVTAREKAKKENFAGTYPVLADKISSSEYVYSRILPYDGKLDVLSANGTKQNSGNLFVLTNVILTDNIIDADISFVGTDGKALEFSQYIDKTGTDFLRFVEPQSAIVAAVGKPLQKDSFMNLANLALGNAVPDAEAYIPYLQAIEGTFAVSAIPVADAASLRTMRPGTWDITASAVFNESDTGGIMSMIRMAGAREITDETAGEHTQYAFQPYDDTEIYAGVFDNVIAASTHIMSGRCENSFSQEFQDARAGIVMTFAPESNISRMLGIPYGAYCSAMLYDNKISAKFRFNGAPRNVLATFISLYAKNAADNISAVQTKTYDEIVPDIVSE